MVCHGLSIDNITYSPNSSEISSGIMKVVKNSVEFAIKTTRPGVVTTNIVTVDDAWWGSFQYRAFDVSVEGGNVDISQRVEEVGSHFRIYVPKRD